MSGEVAGIEKRSVYRIQRAHRVVFPEHAAQDESFAESAGACPPPEGVRARVLVAKESGRATNHGLTDERQQ
jgi:hypothetical protein